MIIYHENNKFTNFNIY